MDDQIGVQLVSILSPGESFYLLSTRYTCDLKYRPRLPVIVIVIGIGTGTETDIVTVTVKENGNDHVASLLLGRRCVDLHLHSLYNTHGWIQRRDERPHESFTEPAAAGLEVCISAFIIVLDAQTNISGESISERRLSAC